MYDIYPDLLIVVLAGLIGCVATGLAVQLVAGIPMNAVAANPGKLAWSIIFALPLPFLLGLQSVFTGLILAYLCLSLLPSVASKLHFGPKDVPYSKLVMFNSVYAVTAIASFLVLKAIFTVAE